MTSTEQKFRYLTDEEMLVIAPNIFAFVKEWCLVPIKKARLYLLYKMCRNVALIANDEWVNYEDKIEDATRGCLYLLIGPAEDFGVRSGHIADGVSHGNDDLNAAITKDMDDITSLTWPKENPYAEEEEE